MHATDIIAKKRDGDELSGEEIEFFIQGYTQDEEFDLLTRELEFFIQGYTQGEIPDYQAAAWLMAVYLRGMSDRETLDLTMAMAHSGDKLDLDDELKDLVWDKWRIVFDTYGYSREMP